ncbi:unnamed protein product [Pleuronectes platessa]|uniref:Uncharacterized protein n=1 Tax=Pleuronectes platessa TaxID=8262 RepID=A0A9N7VT13_PLEPL|nr:unnamed protein product [Pleuronectes platessa]
MSGCMQNISPSHQCTSPDLICMYVNIHPSPSPPLIKPPRTTAGTGNASRPLRQGQDSEDARSGASVTEMYLLPLM